MALYKCPKCSRLVKKDAKRCNHCGFLFDANNEPVMEEETELSKDEKRKLIIFAVVAAIASLAWFFFYYFNERLKFQIFGLLD